MYMYMYFSKFLYIFKVAILSPRLIYAACVISHNFSKILENFKAFFLDFMQNFHNLLKFYHCLHRSNHCKFWSNFALI